MHLVPWSVSALDYEPCRYGASKLLFRGPKLRIDGPHVACLGGSETYGKFVRSPFAGQLGQELGIDCLNLGCHNAGVDAFLQDESVIGIAARAKVKVVQIMGAGAMSNPFYVVHPRRNDRFLQASETMERMFPEVDFTEFSFIHHLLGFIRKNWPDRFQILAEDLRKIWVQKMTRLLSWLGPDCVLLWLAETAPGEGKEVLARPSFVTPLMLAQIRPLACDYVEIIPSNEMLSRRREGMVYLPHEAEAASVMMGPEIHGMVAESLAPVVRKLLRGR